MPFYKKMDRVSVYRDPVPGSSCEVILYVRDGWNDASPLIRNVISLEEARDLHYALGRLIAHVEEDNKKK